MKAAEWSISTNTDLLVPNTSWARRKKKLSKYSRYEGEEHREETIRELCTTEQGRPIPKAFLIIFVDRHLIPPIQMVLLLNLSLLHDDLEVRQAPGAQIHSWLIHAQSCSGVLVNNSASKCGVYSTRHG